MIKFLVLSKAGGLGRPIRFHIYFNKAFLVLGHSFFYTWGVFVQICDSMSMFFTVRKNWAYPPSISGSYRSEIDEILVVFKIFKSIQVKLFYTFNIDVMCQCISAGFSQVTII